MLITLLYTNHIKVTVQCFDTPHIHGALFLSFPQTMIDLHEFFFTRSSWKNCDSKY